MSSETCPFCGKSFKRLKSHLPHCKAAKLLRTPTTQDEVVVSEKTSPLLAQSTKLISPLLEKTITQSMQSKPASSAKSSPQTKRSEIAVSSTVQSASKTSPLINVNISSSLQSPPPLPSASTSLQTSPKRNKKQKLAKEVKMATLPSSQNVSLSPSPTLSLNLPPSKPKKKDLPSHKEAAKSSPVPEVPQEGTKSDPVDLDLLSIPFSPVTDPVISRALTSTGNQNNSYKDSGISQLPLSSTDTRLKKGAEVFAVSKDFKGEGSKNYGRFNTWVDAEGTGKDLSGRERLWGPDQDTVKLQDIKDTLGRSSTSHESRKSILLDRIKASTFVLTTDILPSKTETSGQETVHLRLSSNPVLNQNNGVSPLLKPTVHSNHSSISCQLPIKKGRYTEANKSEQVFFIQNKDDGSAQPKTTSLPSPQIVPHCDPPASVVSLAPSLRSPLSTTEAVNMGSHKMGLVSASPSVPWILEPQTPSCSAYVTHPCPLPPQALPGGDNTMSASALTLRRLGQVTLRELPEWLAIKTPSHPKEAVEIFQRGWQWYYRRYIDVKKGGVGGVGMLLAGYCVLSYIWSYPHLKCDRWRKYH